MTGLAFKYLKTLKIIGPIFFTFFVIITQSGCATTERKREPAHYDDPGYKISQNAQNDWNNHTFKASADYHFALGQAYSNEGRVDRAIEEFQAALAYDPKSAILHGKLAAEYLKKGSTSLAIDACKKALTHDPKYVDVRLMLGGIYSINNEAEDALFQYNEVLKIDAGNDEAAVFKTQVLVEKERNKEALAFIRGFVSRTKDSAAAWFYAGKLEQMHNNTNEAVKDFRKALEIRPGFTQATVSLGLIFETHNESKKAAELYQEQMDQRPDIQVAGRLTVLYLKSNKLREAQKTLEAMMELDPEDLNTQLKLGLVHMQQQSWNEAKEIFLTVLKKVPDSDKVNYYLAAVYEEAGEFTKAIDHLIKVSGDSKLFEDAHIHASILYRKLLQNGNSLAVLTDAIKKSPENPGLYLATASVHEDEKNWKKASDVLSAGLKIFPENEKLLYFNAAILDKLGQQDEAIVEMEKIIKQNPNHADALNFIAYTWTSQGVRLKDAEAMLKKAVKLKPDSPFILDSLGWNQFMLGHSKEAMIYLEKAASLKSDEQAILEHLVEVYTRNQMPERAQALRSRILQLTESVGSRKPASVEEN